MDNNQRRGSGAIAFLIGALAGGLAAVLLAPQTGAETRDRLKRGARDLRERGSQFAHRGEKRVEKVTDAFKDTGSGAQS